MLEVDAATLHAPPGMPRVAGRLTAAADGATVEYDLELLAGAEVTLVQGTVAVESPDAGAARDAG
jgi:hypothetical protein